MYTIINWFFLKLLIEVYFHFVNDFVCVCVCINKVSVLVEIVVGVAWTVWLRYPFKHTPT